MAEDESELEKRAVEELLRETDRARLRAETMGPAGWLKCPLRGTNKRFLLNTLRSTGLRPGEPKAGHSLHPVRRESPAARSRSRSPPAGRDGGRSRKRHRGNTSGSDAKRRDGERERSRGRKRERDEAAEEDRRTSKARTGSAN